MASLIQIAESRQVTVKFFEFSGSTESMTGHNFNCIRVYCHKNSIEQFILAAEHV